MLDVSELICGITSQFPDAGSFDVKMKDAKLIRSKPFRDLRGTFEVFWDTQELVATGVDFKPDSAAFSYNEKAGTLRGMHYHKTPHAQAKLVSCVSGKVLDVIADLRPESSTYMRWAATELSLASGLAIYIPAGYAHGFVTMSENSTVAYLIEGEYCAEAASIVRWDDPLLGINWPVTATIISEQDRLAPDFIP